MPWPGFWTKWRACRQALMDMAPWLFRCCGYLLVLSVPCSSPATRALADEPTIESVFAEVPFDAWQAQGPRQDVPWQVTMSEENLSFHQRLVATIKVTVPGSELVKRRHDERLTLLVEVRNSAGEAFRNYGRLDLDDVKPEQKRSDAEFSWDAFVLPGQYQVDVALWDKKSGEHNFLRRRFHVDAYKKDPLPAMWQGLDAFEFWSTKRDGPEFIFHSDIDGRLNLPLATRRPVQLEVLLDLTPSAKLFRGNYALYTEYLESALPLFKAFSQIKVANGSSSVAAVDIVERRIAFEQSDGKALDWPSFSKVLSPHNGPGVVSVQALKNREQSPVYLREEIVRRLSLADGPAGTAGERSLHVFVLIGGAMDLYLFPKLPEVETGWEQDSVIYYLQLDSDQREITGAARSVEKMLKPLKIHTIHVVTAGEARRALARVLEEAGRF
jgi:hypothetical protein